MIKTITKYHVFTVLNTETGESAGVLELPKNTYSPKAAEKILSEKGFTDSYKLIYDYPVREKRELSDEDFIKYSKVVN